MQIAPTPARELPASIPLSTKPFTVAFDGTFLTGTIALRTVRDIDRLIKVLTAQKAAIEAMQDDDDDSGPNPDDQYDLMREREADEDVFK
jgi:hypothetical protein